MEFKDLPDALGIMTDKLDNKMWKKIDNFLIKNQARMLMEQQIEKDGSIKRLWYVNRKGIHCINLEDL